LRQVEADGLALFAKFDCQGQAHIPQTDYSYYRLVRHVYFHLELDFSFMITLCDAGTVTEKVADLPLLNLIFLQSSFNYGSYLFYYNSLRLWRHPRNKSRPRMKILDGHHVKL
jgi:hypothetical protein